MKLRIIFVPEKARTLLHCSSIWKLTHSFLLNIQPIVSVSRNWFSKSELYLWWGSDWPSCATLILCFRHDLHMQLKWFFSLHVLYVWSHVRYFLAARLRPQFLRCCLPMNSCICLVRRNAIVVPVMTGSACSLFFSMSCRSPFDQLMVLHCFHIFRLRMMISTVRFLKSVSLKGAALIIWKRVLCNGCTLNYVVLWFLLVLLFVLETLLLLRCRPDRLL